MHGTAEPARRGNGATSVMLWSILLVCGALLAPASAVAAPDDVLGYDDARHLLARTGFGPTEVEVRAFTGLTRADAIARLLRTARTTAVTPVPAALTEAGPLRPPGGADATPEERKAFVRGQVQDGLALRAWWVQEMLATPSPLTERLTLFWHNHFVSAQPKVRVTRLMLAQNTLLRANALGDFGTLLHAIAKDPAMIIYLDGAQNRKAAPNENFAREVMELFTLGEGHYAESDIKEAARAFTGWSVDRDTGEFVFRRGAHDGGEKTIFGQTGRFDGDDVLDLLLARPETAAFVTAKLWREFVSPDPDPDQVRRMARVFRDAHYDIGVLMGELLRSDAFFAAEHRGVLVKAPVEIVVGALRQLGVETHQTLPFALASAGMGQNLFSAPNVKGWPGGEAWINASTLLARKQFLERLTRVDDRTPTASADVMPGNAPARASVAPREALAPNGIADAGKPRAQRFMQQQGRSDVRFDSARFTAELPGATPAERNAAAARLLLATSSQRPLDADAAPLAFVRSVLLDAAYELK